jgi:hypothetical protein
MSDLYNLVYVSHRPAHCDNTAVENILKNSRENNLRNDITGLLLCTDNRFMQYIEGDQAKINALFELIKKDKRHSQCRLLYNVPIAKRVFPNWQMGYKYIDDDYYFPTAAGQEDYKLFQQLIEQNAHAEVEGLHIVKLFFVLT